MTKEQYCQRLSEPLEVKVMMAKGFMQAPMLEVNGEIMDFSKANEWINSL